MKKAKININWKKITKIVLIIAVILAITATALFIINYKHSGRIGIMPKNNDIMISVNDGDTLSKILSGQNISGNDINNIAGLLKKDCGISGLRAKSDQLILSRTKKDAPIDKIILISGPWKRIEMECINDVWTAKTIDIKRDVRLVHKIGKIKDGDSFYVAAIRAKIPTNVTANVYDLLAFEIDFERDIHSGQGFSVLYEENYSGTEFINTGNIIAVSFDSLRGDVKMYRFKKSDGGTGYYNENGDGAIKSLKRTPINNARVSSSFSSKRKHPVLGFTRAHKGVDFRAGTGTPIPSAGGGIITERKYGNGYGNYITIKHNKTFSTRYAHMSRFQKGVNIGTKVRQGQTIGYVGSTGLSTGPHLHYEIMKDGVHVNPLTVKLPAIDNLDSKNKTIFKAHRDKINETIKMLSNNPTLFVHLM